MISMAAVELAQYLYVHFIAIHVNTVEGLFLHVALMHVSGQRNSSHLGLALD
jgi:hypothetical protein